MVFTFVVLLQKIHNPALIMGEKMNKSQTLQVIKNKENPRSWNSQEESKEIREVNTVCYLGWELGAEKDH